jgi:hypothetical protein
MMMMMTMWHLHLFLQNAQSASGSTRCWCSLQPRHGSNMVLGDQDSQLMLLPSQLNRLLPLIKAQAAIPREAPAQRREHCTEQAAYFSIIKASVTQQ